MAELSSIPTPPAAPEEVQSSRKSGRKKALAYYGKMPILEYLRSVGQPLPRWYDWPLDLLIIRTEFVGLLLVDQAMINKHKRHFSNVGLMPSKMYTCDN